MQPFSVPLKQSSQYLSQRLQVLSVIFLYVPELQSARQKPL